MASNAFLLPYAKDRTHAATLKPSSASAKSKVVDPISTNLPVHKRHSSIGEAECESAKLYNLGDIAKSNEAAMFGTSDKVYLRYLQGILSIEVRVSREALKCSNMFLHSFAPTLNYRRYVCTSNVGIYFYW